MECCSRHFTYTVDSSNADLNIGSELEVKMNQNGSHGSSHSSWFLSTIWFIRERDRALRNRNGCCFCNVYLSS